MYDFLRIGVGQVRHRLLEARVSGIIHQVVLENYAFPGGMMIGTDSHTPNAGGLGMVAIGVGGADAVDVMTGFPFNVRWPKLIGVHLTGELVGLVGAEGRHPRRSPRSSPSRAAPAPSSSTSARAPTRSRATGKATICNMGAEIGATTSVFAYDDNMAAYLKATGREAIADAADAVAERPAARPRGRRRPDRFYDQVIEIDLDELEPLINGPHTPDLAHPVSRGRRRGRRERRGRCEISSALIGSCTNSSLRGHHPRRVDRPPGVGQGPRRPRRSCSSRRAPSRCGPPSSATACSPTSRPSAATVLANACGPCIGQWERTDLDPSKVNTIVN